jgi:hypothetical protein
VSLVASFFINESTQLHIAILTLRIYAIYDSSRTVLYILLVLFGMELATEMTLIVIICTHLTGALPIVLIGADTNQLIPLAHVKVLPLPPVLPGCAPINHFPYAWAYWIPMTVFESALFLLAAAKAVYYILSSDAQTETPHLAFVLVRDSLFFFGSVVALIILNLVIWVVGRVSDPSHNLRPDSYPQHCRTLCFWSSYCEYLSLLQTKTEIADH